MLLEELPTSDAWTAGDWRSVLAAGDDWSITAYAGAHWAPLGERAPDVTADRIAEVIGWQARSPHGANSREFACVVRLTDGAWAACLAWADETGWGCQDSVEWRVCSDLASIVSFGLDRAARGQLALPLAGRELPAGLPPEDA